MRSFRSLLLAALVLVPLTARAADVPVTYTVDTTALKLAISGTNLTFQLYTDGACTSLAHTQVLTVDNTSLLSVLKRSKPKNGVKPPKTTDIRAKLTGVAPAAPIYLKVTGTGITPVGGACQVQASTTAGLAGTSLVVRDANGTLVGPVFEAQYNQILLSDGGQLIIAQAYPTGFTDSVYFYFTSSDCSGPRLSPATYGAFELPLEDGVLGTTLYYGPTTAPTVGINSYNFGPVLPASCLPPFTVNLPDRCCCENPACYGGGTFAAGPASTMDISGFVPPFTLSVQ